jgi:dihydrofolate reductase
MGRKTFESIGRPLPGRTTVVISRDGSVKIPGVLIAHNLDEALAFCVDDPEPFVAGGGEIYRLALPRAARLYLTLVHAAFEGDTVFPAVDPSQWETVSEERHEADEKNAWPYTFRTLERRK